MLLVQTVDVIAIQTRSFQVDIVHANRCDLQMVVGGIVVNAIVRIAAAAVAGILKSFVRPYASFGHSNRI